MGLGEFNARRNADNFSIDEFREACAWAHVRGVSVYVTLNVAILPSEIDAALDFAREAYDAGADAFIVQDIGLAGALLKHLPHARLHISTQMNVHNAYGIEAAARFGAKRVTLARELSIEEVAHLCEVAAGFGIEVETFAHGALCVCYSGQCLMSSLIGGRSANRGLCAQACRLPYELHNEQSQGGLPAEGEHLLSPRDLCTIDMLPLMVEAGVKSLKIEGRMKSPDYVYAVVSIYRAVLDRVLSGDSPNEKATESERTQLAEAFSRGFTTAYLTGNRGNEIMSYGRPNNRGVFVGRVSAVDGPQALVVPERTVHAGDVLEFWTNRGHFAETVVDPALDVKGALHVPVSQRVGKGDRVFRVRNAEASYSDDEFEPRVRVNGSVEVRLGQPLRISFETIDGAVSASFEGDAVEACRTRALSSEDVRAHVDRLGQTDFAIENLDVVLDEGVGLGFSQLHKARSQALARLRDKLEQRYARPASSASAPRAAKAARRFKGRSASCQVVAWATNPSCARAAKRAGADEIYVPILTYRRGESWYAGARQEHTDQAGYPKKCVMALPTVDHDLVGSAREALMELDPWDYVRAGKKVYADNLAALLRAAELGAQIELGSHVPVTNSLALREAAQFGASRVWLSPELSLGQIADLAEDAPVELGLTIIGAQELMITEHCLLMSQGPCNQRCDVCPRRLQAHHYVDRKGFKFPLVSDALGRSHLFNGVELDIAPSVPDLLDIGISAVMVDTTLMTAEQAHAAVSRAVRARNLALEGKGSVPKRSGTTSGHLFRGVL